MRMSDWSSDVCSSDLLAAFGAAQFVGDLRRLLRHRLDLVAEQRPHKKEEVADQATVEPVLGEQRIERMHQQATEGIDPGTAPLVVLHHLEDAVIGQIGNASCRERVCQYV